MEEERPDEMEVAKKEDEEGKEKAIEEVNLSSYISFI